MAKYYKERIRREKSTLVSKVSQGVIASFVVGVAIILLKPLITNIPLAMLVVGIGSLVVSLFVRPSIKAIWHSLICAACCGIFLLNLTPFVANVYLFNGYKAAVGKNWDLAIKYYEKALRYDPRDGELNFYTGYAYMKKKEYDKAAYHFKKSLQTKLDPSAFNNLGNIYLEQGRFEDAEKAYKSALYTEVSRMYSLNNLGAIYQKTGRLHESLKMFEEALKVNPNYKIAQKNLKVVKALIKRYSFVEKRYGKEFLRYFFTAQGYLQYRRLDKAKDLFLKAARVLIEKDRNVGPSHPDWKEILPHLNTISAVYSLVAGKLVALGELPQAISLYEVTLNFHPRNIKQLYKYIASLYLKLGEKKKADEMLKKAQSLP